MAIQVLTKTVTLKPGSYQTFTISAPTLRVALSAGWYTTVDRRTLLHWKRPVDNKTWEIRLDGNAVAVDTSITLYLVHAPDTIL